MDGSSTGKPSRLHDVVAVGARVLQKALAPVGGPLAVVPYRIPLLTDGVAPRFLVRGIHVTSTVFDGMPVVTLASDDPTGKTVVAVHGGAYVGEATLFHWWTYAGIVRRTRATVVVPAYALSPSGTAATEVPRMADFVSRLVDEHGRPDISVLGDSAGGGLALLTVQEQVRRGAVSPARLVLVAPWLDVSVSDPRSAGVDDPLLGVDRMVEHGRSWAGDLDTRDPLVSPLFGSLDGLPPTAVYCSSRDRLSIDVSRLRDRVAAEGIADFTFRLRHGLLHDFVMYVPLPEAKAERANLDGDLGL